jgi:hypothetical protein
METQEEVAVLMEEVVQVQQRRLSMATKARPKK